MLVIFPVGSKKSIHPLSNLLIFHKTHPIVCDIVIQLSQYYPNVRDVIVDVICLLLMRRMYSHAQKYVGIPTQSKIQKRFSRDYGFNFKVRLIS